MADSPSMPMPSQEPGMNKGAPMGDRAPPEQHPKEKRTTNDDAKLLARARKRFDRCVTVEGDNRKAGIEALNMANGKQWGDDEISRRDGRPNMTINKLKVFVNQVANGQRENRPAINISPEGDRGDKQVAKMLKGVIRKVERDCNADIAYDTAFWNACANGIGWWRICTDYEGPDNFNQVIEIKRVRNPYAIYADPKSIEPDGADMRFAFVTEMMDRGDFEDQYPDADPINFEGQNIGGDYKNWMDEKQIRIAEYFEITHKKDTLYAVSNGWVGTESEMAKETRAKIDSGELEIDNEREVETPIVKWYKITAKDVLDSKEWPGKWVPLVKVIGNEIDIEGKVTLTGVIGDAIGPQKMYNYWASLQTELLAMSPKAPFVVAVGQIEGFEGEWANANNKPVAYLPYQPVALEGQPVPAPQRQQFAGVPTGVAQARDMASQDMQAVTGIRFDGTMHERMADESGKALREIRRATDIGTFHFIDNLSRSLKHTGVILVDLIPKIYDTKRIMTILREDDKEETIAIDPHQAGAVRKIPHPSPAKLGQKITSINPNTGKYGVTVTIGPDTATKRIEAAESIMQFVRAVPQVGPMAMDLIAKNLDGEGMDALAARLAKAIPIHLHDDPNLDGVPPEIQGIIGSQKQQLAQAQQQIMALMKAHNDKSLDRAQAQDKIDKDFEAKLLATVQKADAVQAKQVGDKMDALAGQVNGLMDAFTTHQAALQQQAQQQAQQQQAGSPPQPQGAGNSEAL